MRSHLIIQGLHQCCESVSFIHKKTPVIQIFSLYKNISKLDPVFYGSPGSGSGFGSVFEKPDPQIRIRKKWTGSATLHYTVELYICTLTLCFFYLIFALQLLLFQVFFWLSPSTTLEYTGEIIFLTKTTWSECKDDFLHM